MTTNKPEVIYLIDTGNGAVWCDDPDPMGCGEYADTVKYVRGDVYEALQAEYQRLQAESEMLQAENDALRAKTSISLGVGDGTGNHFVHGDYESIKRVQALIFEYEKLRKLATQCADYLDINDMTRISHGSILHRKLIDASHRKQGGVL